MNWFDVLKNARLSSSQKGKSIDIDSVKGIESEDTNCRDEFLNRIQNYLRTLGHTSPPNAPYTEESSGRLHMLKPYHYTYQVSDMENFNSIPDEVFCFILQKYEEMDFGSFNYAGFPVEDYWIGIMKNNSLHFLIEHYTDEYYTTDLEFSFMVEYYANYNDSMFNNEKERSF